MLRLMCAIVVGVTAIAHSSVAAAQAPVNITFKVLPPGHDGQFNGTRARYYLLNEYLQLAQGDSELSMLRAQTVALLSIQTGLKSELAGKDTIIQGLQNDKDILAARSTRMNGDYADCQTALKNATSSPFWPYLVAIVVGSAGVLGAGVLIGVHLR